MEGQEEDPTPASHPHIFPTLVSATLSRRRKAFGGFVGVEGVVHGCRGSLCPPDPAFLDGRMGEVAVALDALVAVERSGEGQRRRSGGSLLTCCAVLCLYVAS